MVDTDFQTFGLPGEVPSWHVEYLDLLAGPGEGFFWEGAISDWTFTDEDLAAFKADSGFQFLCHALGSDKATELGRRALLGAGLISSSILEQNPDQKLLAAVMALEVLIGDDKKGDKKFRLARRHAFLACSVPHGKMCGRDWPPCPYLKLDPDDRKDFAELTSLRAPVKKRAFPYCSRYREVITLYDARNKAAHEGTAGLSRKEVRDALYPINLWLVPNILRWYADHPDDHELRELDATISDTGAGRHFVPTN